MLLEAKADPSKLEEAMWQSLVDRALFRQSMDPGSLSEVVGYSRNDEKLIKFIEIPLYAYRAVWKEI